MIRHLVFAETEIQVQIEPDFQTEFETDWLNGREKMKGKKEKREKRKKPAKPAARAKRGWDERVRGEAPVGMASDCLRTFEDTEAEELGG